MTVAVAAGVTRYVSIRRTDLCAFERRGVHRRQCIRQSFNPSNGFVCLRTRQATLSRYPTIRFNPSNGFVCLRTALVPSSQNVSSLFQSVERICVPSNSLIILSTANGRGVSIRRTDLCAFELVGVANVIASVGFVSIRRTDLCAFELQARGLFRVVDRVITEFQSVERICVPSNTTPPAKSCSVG